MLSFIVLALIGSGIAAPVSNLRSRAPTYRSLVVFGDSISDSAKPRGAWTLTNETWPPYGNYSAGNFSSGGRFSNGPVWPEIVAQSLNLTLVDYAYGGATSNNALVQGYTGRNSTIPVPSVYEQVRTYLNSTAAQNVSSSVFAILVGANDVLFNTSILPEAVTAQIVNATSLLIKANATAVAYGVPYSFSATPYVMSSACVNCSPDTPDHFDTFAISLLGNLTDASKNLNNRTDIVMRTSIFDLYSFVQEAVSEPTTFGFNASVVQTACFSGAYGEANPSVCSDQDSYLWTDLVCLSPGGMLLISQYHGTTALHRYFAAFASAAISNVTGIAPSL